MKWLLISCITVMVYLLMPQCQAFIVIESMVNEALTLLCNCSGNCPVVRWIRFIPNKAVIVQQICSKQENFNKRLALPGDTSRGDFSLMISSVAYTDAGSYMCRCNEISVTEVKLKVIIPTVVKAFEGKNVTLPCYGDTRQVVKDVKWKKDGHEVLLYTPANRWMTKQNRFTMSVEGFLDGDLSLHISPVHLSDTGLYQCLIHDESQDGEPRAVLLKVEVYLLMPQCQAFIVIESMVNEALTLLCNCSGICPVVRWIRFIPDNVVVQSWNCSKQENFNKRLALPGDTSRGDFSLMISSVAYTDAGSYMCSCNEKSVTEVKLKVIIPTVVKAFEGKNVTLPCYGDTRQAVKDVKWKKDGHEVLLYTPANRWMTKQNRFTMSVEGFLDGDLSLYISPVHLSDTGLYQCLIHDESQGGEPRAVLLKVEGQQQFTTTNSAPVSGGFALLGLFISVVINIYIT
ncbi:neural cell adhesion molecule 1-like [Tachysurus fulvidraco]|uniref:neural cell adhesion molecule 1-like n=1 Tax=Tachysurus fulvidraco TaxID=1234273 RepID=UPI001FED8FA8|nr:neural cell adhesion molecule 1-like [Tachysurus fulvidraco]